MACSAVPLKGSAPVFLSEQTNAIDKVLDHPGVRDDVGYRVEVRADVNEAMNTVSIRAVTRLSEVTAMPGWNRAVRRTSPSL